MASRGRKPKPTHVHLLNGNPSKLNLEERSNQETDASRSRLYDIPEAPEWLDPASKAEWNRVAAELIKNGIMTELDVTALEMYCKSYSRWKEAERQMDAAKTTIMKTGKDGTYLQQLPQVSIAQKYQKICQSWMAEFGLTPSARARGVQQRNDETPNPVNTIFKGKL